MRRVIFFAPQQLSVRHRVVSSPLHSQSLSIVTPTVLLSSKKGKSGTSTSPKKSKIDNATSASQSLNKHYQEQQEDPQRTASAEDLSVASSSISDVRETIAYQLEEVTKSSLFAYKKLLRVARYTTKECGLYHETGLSDYIANRFRSAVSRNIELHREAMKKVQAQLEMIENLQQQHHAFTKKNKAVAKSKKATNKKKNNEVIAQHLRQTETLVEQLCDYFQSQVSEIHETFVPALDTAAEDRARISMLQVLAAGIGNLTYQRQVEQGFFDMLEHEANKKERGEAEEDDVSERQNRLLQQATTPYILRLALLAEAAGAPTAFESGHSAPPQHSQHHRATDSEDAQTESENSADDATRNRTWPTRSLRPGRKMSVPELRERYIQSFLPHSNVTFHTPARGSNAPASESSFEDANDSGNATNTAAPPSVSLQIVQHGDEVVAVEINEALHKQTIFVHALPFDWGMDPVLEDVPVLDADQNGLCRKTSFHEQYGTIASRLVESLLNETPLHRSRATVVCGHGPGGAVALAVAMLLFEQQFDVRNTVTFGAPKLLLEKKFRDTVIAGVTPVRVVIAGDPLVELPVSAAVGTHGDGGLFTHVGEVLVVEDLDGPRVSPSSSESPESAESENEADIDDDVQQQRRSETGGEDDNLASEQSSLLAQYEARGPFVFSAAHYAEVMQRQDAPLSYVESADEIWDEGARVVDAKKATMEREPVSSAGERWKKEREVPL